TPIKPFKFLYDENKNEIGYINMDLASLSKGKEIIINGKVSSQDELDKLNPNEIKTIAGNTKNGKPTIEIDTKNAFKPVKITDKDIYIDGVKSTNEEFNKLDQSTIDKVDVNTFENTIRITTKNITEKKPLIDVNGQIMEPNFDIKTLDPNKIKSTEVLRGIKATGSYGNNHPYVIKIRTSDKNYNLDLEDALFIIDGKETDYNAFFNLRGKVKEIKVTDCRMYEGTSDANKRSTIINYGLKAKNGVVVVKTIPFDKEQDKELNSWKVGVAPSEEGIKQAVSNQSRFASYNAVVIIDGKIGDFAKEFHLLNPNEIASIKVRKVSDGSQKYKDEMVLKYGKKALNGIVEVETKRF
ncbi:MAG: hypothetical protein QG594_2278, partial [Bacteroidota bacterium]|nr:hypothetical protein [Bacteroidota bacterium]